MRTSRRAEPDRHLIGKRDRRPGQAGDALDRAEQAGKAADLGIHILLAALGDERAGPGRGEYFRAGIGGSAEHADGVIMRQQDVFDRLVGDFRHPFDHLPRHDRRGLRVDRP